MYRIALFYSDGVPEEANIVNTTKISLLKNSKEWAEIILEKTNNFERKDCSLKIKEANYDIKNIISKLERDITNNHERIGILTFQKTHNYGALLQAYALCTKISQFNNNCSIINYYHRILKKFMV
jgi:hypothetical protein